MFGSTNKSITYINLDFVRGVSAILVLLGHSRSFTLMPPSQQEGMGLAGKLLYFVTGFGHQAVMIFFVLSGFFISRSIMNLLARDQWTWRRYLVSRMSRLWVVLLPALFLTVMWDHLGMLFGHAEFYQGIDVAKFGSIPGTGKGGVDLTISTFVQNSLFLVGVTEPNVVGTNGPLWSLTYEFWYYMIFPLVFLAFLPITGRAAAVLSIVLVAFFFWLLPFRLLWMGIIWLYGYAVLVLNHSGKVRQVTRTVPYLVVTFLVFAALMVATRADLIVNRMYGDLAVGLSFAFFMLALISHDIKSPWFIAVSTFISKISYSLYLVHFSFLAFLMVTFMGAEQLPFGATGISIFAGVTVLTIVYATAVHWCFERNTYRVIAFMRRVLRC